VVAWPLHRINLHNWRNWSPTINMIIITNMEKNPKKKKHFHVDIPPSSMASYNCQIIQPFNTIYHWLSINHTINGLRVQQGMCFSIQKKWTWVSIFPLEGFIRLWCPTNDVGPNQHWWMRTWKMKTWTKFV
jgi:hypothetical protein